MTGPQKAGAVQQLALSTCLLTFKSSYMYHVCFKELKFLGLIFSLRDLYREPGRLLSVRHVLHWQAMPGRAQASLDQSLGLRVTLPAGHKCHRHVSNHLWASAANRKVHKYQLDTDGLWLPLL